MITMTLCPRKKHMAEEEDPKIAHPLKSASETNKSMSLLSYTTMNLFGSLPQEYEACPNRQRPTDLSLFLHQGLVCN